MLDLIFSWRRRLLPLLLITIVAPLYADNVEGSNTEPEITEASYVVIGAFAYHNNAIRFTEYARKLSLDAKYSLNAGRNLYYVYVFVSQDVNDAIREVHKIRSMRGFRDAWVYTGLLGNDNSPEKVVDEEPIIVEQVSAEQSYEEQESLPEDDYDYGDDEESIEEYEESTEEESYITEEETEPIKEETLNIEKEEGYHYLYFNTINTKNYKEVKGKVKVIDAERAKELAVEKSHELVKVRDPKNGTGRIKLATDIFGFREVQHLIDLDNPVTDTTSSFVEMIGDSIIVNFELKRFKKGDVLVMYNVYFYIDAAIMKPESIYELNSLLDMLRENDKLKVRIHGHTNGNSHGKIVHLNTEDKNFFSLDAAHKESNGSAKKLSMQRAFTIQHWLMEQGIKEDRMEIKGWGGKKMLFDKHDIQAHKNVRVEVEIVEE